MWRLGTGLDNSTGTSWGQHDKGELLEMGAIYSMQPFPSWYTASLSLAKRHCSMYVGCGQMSWLGQNLQWPPSLWSPVDWCLGTCVLLYPTSTTLLLPVQLSDIEDGRNLLASPWNSVWLIIDVMNYWDFKQARKELLDLLLPSHPQGYLELKREEPVKLELGRAECMGGGGKEVETLLQSWQWVIILNSLLSFKVRF